MPCPISIHVMRTPSLPGSEFDGARRRARAEAVWGSFVYIAPVMAVLYAIFLVAHYFVLPESARAIMMVSSFGATLVLAAISVYLYQNAVRESLAHPIAALVMLVILINSGMHLYLSGESRETTNFVLLVIGCGIFFCSTRWLVSMLTLIVLTWLVIAYPNRDDGDWVHFGFFAFQVVLISILVHTIRLRSLDRLVRTQLANEKQREELTDSVQALARAQERLERISEATFEAVFLHHDGRIVDVNDQAVRLFGYSRDELKGMDMSLLLAPEARIQFPLGSEVPKRMPGSGHDGRIHESLGLHKSGRRFPVEYGALRQEQRGAQVDGVVIRDISDRQRLEQRLRDFVENAADYIYETDASGRFTYVNAAIQALPTGKAPLIGTECYQFVYPDSRNHVRNEVETHDFLSAPILYQEFRVDTGSETVERWIGQNVQPILLRGAVAGYRVVARDITERIMAIRAVMAARQEADEANRAKSRFLSSMSHELRTPLNGILGFAQLLQEDVEEALTPRQQKYAASLTDCSAHLLTLIDDLLDLSKVEIEALELRPVPLSVEALAQSAATMVRRDADEKAITIRLVADGDERVVADPRRMRQILINLLGNAVKFSPHGGEILVTSQRTEDGFVEIVVEDDGPGVRPEHQEPIFTEFFQADHVRDGSLGGSGIGLALVKKLVLLHSGSVGYRDRPGGGSSFWVRLPATDEAATDLSGDFARGQLRPTIADARILVVDDIEANLFLLTEALSARGHVVETARNGLEAIARAQEFDPALILMDMRMPVMDGFEATRRLKSMKQFCNTPVVALTASVSPDAIVTCLRAGCAEHLGKPLHIGALFECIDRNLGPVRAPEARTDTSQKPQPDHDSPPPAPLRVLIAEDNETNRSFMCELFKRLPDSVEFANDGRAAVAMALSGDFDLVLMDIHMPLLNGIEATREIRRHRDAGALPIIGLSGVGAPEEVERCWSVGMNDFLTKPVRFARILEVLGTYRRGSEPLSDRNRPE